MKKLAVVYFFLLFFTLSFFGSGVVDSQDGFQYLAVARNIYYKKKPSAPPYEFDTRKNIHMIINIGKDGDSYAFTGLGYSLALVPAVALTDLVYRTYHVSPPIHFPLENDWLLPLLASFTNVFFGAVLGTVLFLYLYRLKLSVKQALLISSTAIFATNLFVYTKHAMAHMMFITFLMIAFYLLKVFADTAKKKYLFWSGLSMGIVMITYNATYLLTLPSYGLYYLLLLKKPSFKFSFLLKSIKQLVTIGLGFLPLFIIYKWFENLRIASGPGMGSAAFLANFATSRSLKVPITILFEGLYGQLLSPGRGFFLYSPVILVIAIFWFKLKKRMRPELLVFLLFFLVYIFFYGSLFSIGQPGQGITTLWTGESSWGPRYLTPLIPFAMLVVGSIYVQLKKIHKVLIVLPLLLVGLYIEMLGVLMPYQIKYHDLNRNFVVNQTEFTVYDYVNIIPRYSPVLMMSRKLIKLIEYLPKTIDRSIYNVRFWDGIDFPFNVGPERWRVIEDKGYIKFDNDNENPVDSVLFGLVNHVMGKTESSVQIIFKINGNTDPKNSFVLKPNERRVIKLVINKESLLEKDNSIEISRVFADKSVKQEESQILAILSVVFNTTNVNIESIDIPYVSSLGPAIMGVSYGTYGGLISDPWKYWEIHTQTFERLPDLWWIRNLYYWDVPKNIILYLLAVNILGLLVSSYLLKFSLRRK